MAWRGWADDADEVLRSIGSRRGRTAMLILAVALSVGSATASIGLGRTAAQQIAADLAADIQDEVTLEIGPADPLHPADAEQRASDLALVTAAGLRIDLPFAVAEVDRPGGLLASGLRPAVWAVTEGYLDEIGVHHASGWAFDPATSQPVALVGSCAAERLGLAGAPGCAGASILVAGRRLPVLGVVTASERDICDVVLIPCDRGVAAMGGDAAARLVMHTEPGAGARVADALAAAVRPDAPTSLSASRVVDLAELRAGVDPRLSRFTAMLGAVPVVITGLLIGNATASSVTARTAEIGLRRALGASSGVIGRLFLGEGLVVGLAGGVLGAALGGWAVVAVSSVDRWTAVVEPALLAGGLVLGPVTGVLASGAPAVRAARIPPAQAVRIE
ncbi:MAG TPA: ABC transporter permease [Cellulomonas sp.]